MIESLVLSYVVILWLLFKQFHLIPLTKWTGLTAALIGIFGLTSLILLMNMYQPWTEHASFAFYTTPIVPQVKGEVIEVPVETNKLLRKGDVLFKIDPSVYQAEVTRLKAQLVQTEKGAEMLTPKLAEAESRVAGLKAKLSESGQQAEALTATLTGAKAAVVESEVAEQLAEVEFARAKRLLPSGAITEEEHDRKEALLRAATAGLEKARSVEKEAQLAVDSKYEDVNTMVAQTRAELAAAEAVEVQAKLAIESQIDGVNTLVAQTRAALEKAEYELKECVVTAPTDGYVTQLQLRPGMVVTAFPISPVMVFVHEEEQIFIAAFQQNALQGIEVGNDAEIAFDALPGRVFHGKVESIIPIVEGGQMRPTGGLISFDELTYRQRVPLKIDITDDLSDYQLPMGASALVTVYTHHSHATSFLRKFIFRMRSWENYVFSPHGSRPDSGGH